MLKHFKSLLIPFTAITPVLAFVLGVNFGAKFDAHSSVHVTFAHVACVALLIVGLMIAVRLDIDEDFSTSLEPSSEPE